MKISINTDDTKVYVIFQRGSTTETKVFDYLEELAIDEDNLNECFIEQSGKYVWWGTLYEEAKIEFDMAKAQLERAEAEADDIVRRELEMDGVKVTEALVNRKIKKEGVYVEALTLLYECKKKVGILDRVVKAFDHRLEALISIGANIRKEYNNMDINVKKEQARNIINN